jgi:hypothetical protein
MPLTCPRIEIATHTFNYPLASSRARLYAPTMDQASRRLGRTSVLTNCRSRHDGDGVRPVVESDLVGSVRMMGSIAPPRGQLHSPGRTRRQVVGRPGRTAAGEAEPGIGRRGLRPNCG